MVYATLNVQKTGMITLPKKWRDKHPATVMIAEETAEGLLIKPLLDVQYWEDEIGNFGLHFPTGVEPGRLIQMFEEARSQIDAEKIAKKKPRISR